MDLLFIGKAIISIHQEVVVKKEEVESSDFKKEIVVKKTDFHEAETQKAVVRTLSRMLV